MDLLQKRRELSIVIVLCNSLGNTFLKQIKLSHYCNDTLEQETNLGAQ